MCIEIDTRQRCGGMLGISASTEQGLARLSARQPLEASLRMRPDWILLAKMRGEEAYYYLGNLNSGHPGSITSVHAS